MSAFNLGTATGRIIIDGSQAKSGFGVAQVAANAFYGAVTEKLDSVKELGTRLTAIGTAGTGGLGLAVRAAANFEQSLSGVKAVSGATTEEMDKLRQMALRIGKDTSFSALDAADAIQELSKAGVSTTDILSGAADATVALAAAGEIDLPRAAEIASSAINNFAIKGAELPHVADLIAGAANASAIDVGDFGFSLSQAGAVAHLTGLSFDDLSVAIAEMGQAGIKGSDAGTSIKTFLTNLIPTTNKQIGLFEELGLQTFSTGNAMKALSDNGVKPLSRDNATLTDQLQKLAAKLSGSKVGSASATKEFLKLGETTGFMQNQFFDAQGNMKKFSDVQQVLSKATAGLTKEQKLNTLNTLFGSDAIRASAVFADQGAAGYNKMAAAIGKVSAADVAKTRLDNLNGSIENLKGSFETAQITIGEVFLPVVRKLVDGINVMVNLFNNAPAPLQKFIAVFIGLGSIFSLTTGLAIKLAFVLGPMLARFLGLRALKSVFGIFFEGFRILRSGAGIFAAVGGAAAEAGVVVTRFIAIGRRLYAILTLFPRLLAILRTASTLAFGPWGIALLAVAAAAFILYKKFKPFHDLVNQVASIIKNQLVAALNFAKRAFDALVIGFKTNDVGADGFLGKMEKLGTVVRGFVEKLKDLYQIFLDKVVPALKVAGGQILTQLGKSWKEIVDTFQSDVMPALRQLGKSLGQLGPPLSQLWTALQPVIIALAKVLYPAIGIVYLAFIKFSGFLIGTVMPIMIRIGTVVLIAIIIALTKVVVGIVGVIGAFVQFVAFIQSHFMPAVNAIGDGFKAVFGFIGAVVKNAIDTVAGEISAGAHIISAIFTAITSTIAAIWNGFWNGPFGTIILGVLKIIQLAIQLWAAVVTLIFEYAVLGILFIVTKAFQGIQAIITAVVNFLVPILQAFLNTALAIWTTVFNAIAALTVTVWNAIKNSIMGVINFLKPPIVAWLNFVKAAYTTAWNILKTITSTAWNLIKSYIINPMNAVGTFINGKLNSIKSIMGSAWNALKSITTSAWNSLISIIKGKTNTAMSPIAALKGRIQGFFSGAGGWLVSAGKAIIQGLINGIQSLIGKLTGLLDKVTNLIPVHKGPIEKDRTLLTENGKAIMQSLIDGFESQIPAIEAALHGLTASIPATVAVQQTVNAKSAAPTAAQTASTTAGVVVNNNWAVYNPVAEKTSITTTREATRRAALGVLA